MRNLIVGFLLMASLLIPVHGKAFSDVTLYKEELQYLTQKQVITGYPDGTFKPQQPVTRLQAATMILRELKPSTSPNTASAFRDVPAGAYSYDIVMQAAALQMMTGKGDGTFDRFGYVTRGQLAKMLVQAYNLKLAGQPPVFRDVAASNVFAPYIDVLASHRLITGYPDATFRPYEPVTRLHFALFYSRLLQQLEAPSTPPNVELIPKPTDPTIVDQ